MQTPSKSKKATKLFTSGKKGMPPGSLIYTGKQQSQEIIIEVIHFSKDNHFYESKTITEIQDLDTSQGKYWINIIGLSNVDIIKQVCDKFGIHSLFIEDILNIHQRPKLEVEQDYLYVPFKSFHWNDAEMLLEYEQFSFILLKNVLLTFQEHAGDQFDGLRDRISKVDSVVRNKGLDYLFYRLIDVTVDHYFEAIENIGDHLENLENKILKHPHTEDIGLVQVFNREIMILRRHVFPLREVLFRLSNADHPVLDIQTRKYFLDVLDHTIQVIDTIETYREINFSLRDLQLNTISYEMNRVVKTLTVISTYFIPVTFIVGIYGMNFRYMPELEMHYAYYVVIAVMVSMACGMLIYYKKKKWF